MLIRALAFLPVLPVLAGAALLTTACSSLTKPDEILIVAEPAAAPKAAPKPMAPAPPSAPMRPAPVGAAVGGHAAQPAVPAGCGG